MNKCESLIFSCDLLQEQLGGALMVSDLFEHWYASRAFLEGRVGTPDSGSTEEELHTRARLSLLKAQHSPGEFTEQLLPQDLLWVEIPEEDQ